MKAWLPVGLLKRGDELLIDETRHFVWGVLLGPQSAQLALSETDPLLGVDPVNQTTVLTDATERYLVVNIEERT